MRKAAPSRARALSLLVRALACATTAACGEDALTEVVVAVDTDMAVPGALDAVRIDIVGPGGEVRQASGALDGAFRLPASVGIAHRGGPLGPLRVTVTGSLDGRDVLQRRARLDFVPGRVVVLRLWLSRACVGVRCAEDETCDRGGCRGQRVDPGELEEWQGRLERRDAGPAEPPADAGIDGAADACVPRPEGCNHEDDDCDDAVDEDFDLTRDPDHCGACGNACPADPPNASGVCADGACRLVCDPGFLDCDADEASGCEAHVSLASSCGRCALTCADPTPLCAETGGVHGCVSACGGDRTQCGGSCVDTRSAPRHCGGCDVVCPAPAHATAACDGSRCAVLCDPGFRDCDGVETNGCESQLRELGHCGACGVACAPANAVPTCATGRCAVASCQRTYRDCNGVGHDGCEVDTAADAAHCGACGGACSANPPHAASICVAGRCALACDPLFADCNGRADDGCESYLRGSVTCGSCGIRCEGATPLCGPAASGGFACVAACAVSETLCAGTCADTAADVTSCGSCASPCPEPARATPTCTGGACGSTCDAGWEDCNLDASDGCEARLGTVAHCGACGASCLPADGTGLCVAGACVIASCAAGAGDCDGLASTGCEARLATDRSNCGACGADCAALPGVAGASCVAGTCVITSCVGTRADCNGASADGCEADTATDPRHCGACGAACAGGSCAGGLCR